MWFFAGILLIVMVHFAVTLFMFTFSACAICTSGMTLWDDSDFGVCFFLQGKQLSTMLDEDPALMERRVQLSKRLDLFKQARDEIDAVACGMGEVKPEPRQPDDLYRF
jgi:hypothetical protein